MKAPEKMLNPACSQKGEGRFALRAIDFSSCVGGSVVSNRGTGAGRKGGRHSGLVHARLQSCNEVGRREVAISGPIAFFPGRIVVDGVFVFAGLKNLNEVCRSESTVAVCIARTRGLDRDLYRARPI